MNKKILPILLTLLLIGSVAFSMKEPPVEALTAIETATESIDNKTPSDPSTVTEQDQTQALIGEVQTTPTENTVLDRLKDVNTSQLDGNQKTQIVDSSNRNLAGVVDSDGNFLVSTHPADFHEIPVNRRFAQFPATNTTTLSANITAQDYQIDIQAADYANYTVGDWLYIEDGNTQETEFAQITVKPGSPTLTLDHRLDSAYDSATTTIEEVITNMVVNGSLASPVSFIVKPPANEVWHITRMNLTAVTANASASDDFLSINALTNGAVIREYDNGSYKTWTVWKSDSDIMVDQYDLDNVPTVPAAGAGQRGRWWLKRADVIMKLEGANGDFAEVLVQDNLTGADLVLWSMKAQGHKEGL